MKSRIAQPFSPSRAIIVEREKRQEEEKGDHCQRNPGILNADLVCERNGIESDGEAVHLPPKVDQGTELRRLGLITLEAYNSQSMETDEFKVENGRWLSLASAVYV